MLELAEQVIQLTGSKSQIVHMPLPKDDPTQRRPDITQAQQLLAWQPAIDLKQGLLKTIEYFKNNI
jgi:UDP-glucuronate decarboxylase